MLWSTNLENTSLTSAGRNNKATSLLTVLSSTFKSSAKDSSPRIFQIAIQSRTDKAFPPSRPLTSLYDTGAKLYSYSSKMCEGRHQPVLAWILT